LERSQVNLPSRQRIELCSARTLIIGSGAAGLNCAEHLWELGHRDIAVVTDKLGGGASANSGSDKQTYYKIGIFGDVPDSPMDFARTLTAGGMMHGDIAYVEALASAPEFFHLVRNGVAFPHNRYGAYVGYKTDHDPRQRATSAGPKTSMMMVEKSLAHLRGMGVPIMDHCEIIALLTSGSGDEKRAVGALGLDLEKLKAGEIRPMAFNCANVVMATGGPGEMYAVSVYPPGQIGNIGLALEIGAIANNLTESQFGPASLGFRWNLSGTYQQVIPCYFSEDARGGDRRYFLNDYFSSMRRMAGRIFLKGYQWPFNSSNLENDGSSLVDLAIERERLKGRKVFMDFASNPAGGGVFAPFDLADLEPEAARYLERSGAKQATPLERLRHMNPAAIDIYAEHNVDLREPLEVAVCAQHCNGGLRGNIWWESNIRRFFPIGELNGTHGIRPGGCALNSGQVGGLRAAQYISNVCDDSPMNPEDFLKVASPQISSELDGLRRYSEASASAPAATDVRSEIQERMTRSGAFIRSADGVREALADAKRLRARIAREGMRVGSVWEIRRAAQNEHLCLTHVAFLEAMNAYISAGGGSRGACVILDPTGDRRIPLPGGEELCFRSENVEMRNEILEVRLNERGAFEVTAVPVRPLPEDDSWYETTWAQWRDNRIFD